MSYQPGIHLIATLQTDINQPLCHYENLREQVEQLIAQHRLQKLGEVYHNFSPAGFTAVVCLSESHIAIHTWPEDGRINLDIYLSNFQRNNDGAVHDIYKTLQRHFNAAVVNEQIITR